MCIRDRLTRLRRTALEALDEANLATYPFRYRDKERMEAQYVSTRLDYRDNVANSLSSGFYRDHGVRGIESAMEVELPAEKRPLRVMTTRHCILRELGMCRKEKGSRRYTEPLSITSGNNSFRLEFNCRDCEMHVLLQ